MLLQCRNKTLDLHFPRVMGILNVTPDSFSDGGKFPGLNAVIDHALTLIEDGADILDIGGESTRPGAQHVSVQEELARVLPVVEALAGVLHDKKTVISVDTRRTEVMQAALQAGADMINDIQALEAPRAAEVVAQSGAAACLMHMRGNPQSMQQQVDYDDVVAEVHMYLQQRLDKALAAGIARQALLVDPGIGFGKSTQGNLSLIKHISQLQALQLPILLGVSRKRFLGNVTGRAVDEREWATIATNLYAYNQGVRIFRVHHVRACRDALVMYRAIEESQ